MTAPREYTAYHYRLNEFIVKCELMPDPPRRLIAAAREMLRTDLEQSEPKQRLKSEGFVRECLRIAESVRGAR